MESFRRLLPFLRPQAGPLVFAAGAAAIYAVFDAAIYVLLIPFVDALFIRSGPRATSESAMQGLLDGTVHRWIDTTGDPLVAVSQLMVVILAAFLVKNVFAFVRSYLLARAEQGVNRDLRNAVYAHRVELDLGFFGRTRAGQIVSRLTTEVEQVRVLVTREVSRLVSAGFEFAIALAAMLLISWKLTLAAFVVIPLAMGVWGPMVRVLRGRDRRVLHLGGEVHAHVAETLSGMRLVKSASAEGRERTRFRRLTAEYYREFMRAELARALAAPMTEMLAAIGTVVLLGYGARLVVGGEVTGAEFVGFLGLSLKLYAPMKSVAKFPATAQPGLVAAERVFEFLDTPVEITDAAGAHPVARFQDEILFRDVSFAYGDGPEAVRGLSFGVPRGSVVALVGPSGSGKSTIADLICRFFDPTSGSVTIDGVDLRQVRVADLRALLGIVSQETVLFHDTVQANIAYGAPHATDDEVRAAARAAHADEFIERLPRGYATVVGERGVELSGGQRQRLAIARAILRDPQILIFDEATSALDSESERLVQDAVERLLEGRTAVVVAHRLSTVQRADLILVLDRGRIVERGTHEALLAESGLYRRLHDLQFRDASSIS